MFQLTAGEAQGQLGNPTQVSTCEANEGDSTSHPIPKPGARRAEKVRTEIYSVQTTLDTKAKGTCLHPEAPSTS